MINGLYCLYLYNMHGVVQQWPAALCIGRGPVTFQFNEFTVSVATSCAKSLRVPSIDSGLSEHSKAYEIGVWCQGRFQQPVVSTLFQKQEVKCVGTLLSPR